ncbi:transposase [Paraburkholderia ginsengisoli]|jgi:transposase|uniref:Transposase n=1 Tax=Paraburkholderia ginsengisoli TaxID=311231 RepID=A0A7T4TB44_9BURK|nr:transposase [Paraburkholderia ginsengisoli]QQC66827.1 transposase [Paraburkholderia ginsengisoli]
MNTLPANLPDYWPAFQDLTDEQWQSIAPLLPEMLDHGPRRGRPTIDIRRVLNSVMWVLHTREPWSAMPDRYVAYQTAHRYYLRWKRSGVLRAVALALFETDAILERRIVRKSSVREA